MNDRNKELQELANEILHLLQKKELTILEASAVLSEVNSLINDCKFIDL